MKANFLSKRFSIRLLLVVVLFITVASSIIIHDLIQIKKDQLKNLLLQEESNIENILLERFNTAFFLMEKMGKEIAKNPENKPYVSNVLNKYKSDPSFNQLFSWTIFSWSNTSFLITVDGEYGIMKNPVSLATRDYVQESITRPWARLLGKPVMGSTSNKWMIPGGIGVADLNDQTLGTITIGFEIEALAKIIRSSLKDKNVNVELIYGDNLSVFNINKSTIKLSRDKLEPSANKDEISINKKIQDYPYSLVLSYDSHATSLILREIIYSRMIEILLAVLLSCCVLILIYKNEKSKRREIEFMQREVFLNRSRSEFMRHIGHELKNFVAAVSGLSNVVKEDLKESDLPSDSRTKEMLDNLDHIEDISNELNSFVGDLIDLNQVEDENFEIVKSSAAIDFEDVVERSVRILRSRAKDKNISISINCESPLNKVYNLDQRRIKQILISLISNAIKFSQNNSKIDISVKNFTQNKVVITIKDYGVGMSDSDIIKHLSETNLASEKSDSIELKLPIVKLLVEKQKGTLKITSEKTRGTTVEILF